MGKQDKRAAIIKATICVVAENGFQGASMTAIAARAGVAAGTIYLHFVSKDQLIQEAYKKLESHCLATLLTNYAPERSIRERFSHLAHGAIAYCMRFPAEFLFLDHFLMSPYRKSILPTDINLAGADNVLQLIHEGIEKQIFEDLPPAMLIALAFGTLNQVLRAQVAGEISLDPVLINQTVEACWRTVCCKKDLHQTAVL